MSTTGRGTLTYDVFVNDPPPQDGMLPNGEPKLFSPMASTLICGSEDAVLTDPGMTIDQARALGDWVASKGRNLIDIFVTHGHGDHWFAAGLLAERFGARVVASAGTIAQMEGNAAARSPGARSAARRSATSARPSACRPRSARSPAAR